jgi:hypothetical protein
VRKFGENTKILFYNLIFKIIFNRSRSQSVELRQDFIMEAKRNYERNRQVQAHHVSASGHVVMAVSGRRPSTDAAFPRRDFFGKPAVNLVRTKDLYQIIVLYRTRIKVYLHVSPITH